MIKAVIVIHVIVCIGLIFAVLLHSGKGAGLSNAFGGAMASGFSGTTIIERNLNRITIVLAIIFAITSVVLYLFY
ncbi:MAG: preprotein translocase subunit SecG [Actinobacteria bacterium]|nr:MAG: preprotein translocase subunit SecG [Actinomycetota bacterium]